ncbi:ArsR/SmtB family transcription factor [Methanocella sp. MCL-LM]|uniref:ArsR/SmtB family transcription factor n=1 Tax=Methanocella sp. MCL-LM TaxID=3412035 RepID=UPI003C71C113
MPAKSDPEGKLKDILVIDKAADMRLLFSRKHSLILNLVTDGERSISDIARSLDMNPGSVHYHLKELERHGLVKQVREEIKGGVVKKYYRSAAKQIVLERPAFNRQNGPAAYPTPESLEEILIAIEFLGYQLPADKKEDAVELLRRYDKRMKSLLIELQKSGLENVEGNGFVTDVAFNLILGLKSKDDPELARLYSEFEKLFMRYE